LEAFGQISGGLRLAIQRAPALTHTFFDVHTQLIDFFGPATFAQIPVLRLLLLVQSSPGNAQAPSSRTQVPELGAAVTESMTPAPAAAMNPAPMPSADETTRRRLVRVANARVNASNR
jgi:hypothetical protein